MDALRNSHARISAVIGYDIEPVSVLACVEQHRAYWRPETVRVVLLAESHVYTTASEIRHCLRSLPGLPGGVQRDFVRLVYCLGYGENGWLDQPILAPPNSGTPQFWKVFYSCVQRVSSHADFAPLQAHTAAAERLHNKLQLLHALRERGIWLVDASIAAVYLPRRLKPSSSLIANVLQTSWDSYTESVVRAAEPEAVLCIGLGVTRALRTRLERLGVPSGAVPQPNARLSTIEHLRTFATCRAVCEDPRRVCELARNF